MRCPILSQRALSGLPIDVRHLFGRYFWLPVYGVQAVLFMFYIGELGIAISFHMGKALNRIRQRPESGKKAFFTVHLRVISPAVVCRKGYPAVFGQQIRLSLIGESLGEHFSPLLGPRIAANPLPVLPFMKVPDLLSGSCVVVQGTQIGFGVFPAVVADDETAGVYRLAP